MSGTRELSLTVSLVSRSGCDGGRLVSGAVCGCDIRRLVGGAVCGCDVGRLAGRAVRFV